MGSIKEFQLKKNVFHLCTIRWDFVTSATISHPLNIIKIILTHTPEIRDYRTTSSPSWWLLTLYWTPSSYQRRANAKLVMIYGITYGLIDNPASLYLHWALLSATYFATWHPTAGQMSTGIQISPLQSDCGTRCRKASWLPQPLRSPGWVCSSLATILYIYYWHKVKHILIQNFLRTKSGQFILFLQNKGEFRPYSPMQLLIKCRKPTFI